MVPVCIGKKECWPHRAWPPGGSGFQPKRGGAEIVLSKGREGSKRTGGRGGGGHPWVPAKEKGPVHIIKEKKRSLKDPCPRCLARGEESSIKKGRTAVVRWN